MLGLFLAMIAFDSANNYTSLGRKCTGSKSCNACKNCKYCKHCAKKGGTCGVCK